MSSTNLFLNQNDGSSRSANPATSEQATREFNPQMLVIAREARGLTQRELAERTGLVQSTVSKLEDGLIGLSDELALKFEAALGFPRDFFFIRRRIEWSNIGLYRRRVTMPAIVLKKCEAQMN